MSDSIVVVAQARNDEGKGASRRLRRNAGQMPAVIYGGDKAPASISVEHKEMMKFVEKEEFFTSILSIEVDGAAEQVVIQDLQRHPAKEALLHADFLRVDEETVIKQLVPLHYTNEDACKGVKLQGGKIKHLMVNIQVVCKAKDLPNFVEVDMIDYEKGAIVHLSDVTLPENVKSAQLVAGNNLPIASL